jgi:signal peptidase I
MKRTKLWDYAMVIGGALIAILILRSEFIESYKIISESMIPTLLVGDNLLANKFVYGLNLPFFNRKIFILTSPHRRDIIVFRSPEDPRKDLIKRVIAVEGDSIEERNKEIFVNGKPADEPYVLHTDSFLEDPRDDFGPYVVPRGKLFAMGDNRDVSYDSRYFGFVDVKDVEGKASLLYWSWDSEKHLPRFARIGLFLGNK